MANTRLLIPLAQAKAFLMAAEKTGGTIEVETPMGLVRFRPSNLKEDNNAEALAAQEKMMEAVRNQAWNTDKKKKLVRL